MVSFYKPAKGKTTQRTSASPSTVTVDSWDWKGQGVVRGKPVTFITGALPGEQCKVRITRHKRQMAEGYVIDVLAASDARQTPFCPVANSCGGCQLQHVASDKALEWRQQAIDQLLRRTLAKDTGQPSYTWLPPLTGPKPGYRRKARLAVDARNPDKIAIGYRAQRDNRVVDIEHCPVLVPTLSALIAPLKVVLSSHSGIRHIGHIGLLAGDEVSQITLKAVRPLAAGFQRELTAFARTHQVNLLIEASDGTLETLNRQGEVQCKVSDDRYLAPGPNDFIQINQVVNQAMIAQAQAWLDVREGERVADLFCGLGNFSLALADAGARVLAVEGVAAMVQRAKKSAQQQGIGDIDWQHHDLAHYDAVIEILCQTPDKVLLDPSREGASVVCQALADHPVARVVYVSCNPSTFARDAGILQQGGYQLEKVSLIEMFPYTQHLEMMALFTMARG